VIDVTPDPTAIQLGPLAIGWYGLGYAAAITVGARLAQIEVRRKGIDPRIIIDGLLLTVIFGLIGARLYHVIDQFNACGAGEPCYRDNLARIVLPPYSGLGLYGGILGGIVGILVFARRRGISALPLLDAAAPAMLGGLGFARWGNVFNQELYGGPTDLPWGIKIDCAHRVAEWSCAQYPEATTGFHPLFFYESALDLLGAVIALYVARRFVARLRDGDVLAFWFIWYGSVRTLLEPFRSGYNWTVGGIPTAMLIGVVVVVGGVVFITWNHRRERPEPTPSEEPAEPDGPEPALEAGATADIDDGMDAAVPE
jgi:phosphatidylglycerol:prolipoprotein diacylglycerol transferase